jgi:multiple sugar transport system ATP-binding protein
MNAGRLQQMAAPESIYDHPANAFVAGFIGTPKINFFSGTVLRDGGIPRVSFLDCSCSVNGSAGAALQEFSTSTVTVGFRPEEIRIASDSGGRQPTAKCVIEMVEPLGSETNVVARYGDQLFVCKTSARSGLAAGDSVTMEFDTSQIKLFDAESGNSLGYIPPSDDHGS